MLTFISICVCSFVSLQAYTLISNEGDIAYWPKNSVSYRFNTTSSGYFSGGHDASGTPTDEFAPIRQAFATWTQVGGINLSITERSASSASASAGDDDNTVIWVRSGWRSLSFRPPSNALAVTLLSFDGGSGEITDADIYFNAESFKWAVVDAGSENSYVDIANIATHEIGHFLGLDHSSEDLFEEDPDLLNATMYFASTSGETSRRDLSDDDKLAIQTLYGNTSRGSTTISSIELISAESGTIEYRIRGSGFNSYTNFIISKTSGSEYDAVSRYRSVISESEAVAKFDTLGMSSGKASLLAFNDPRDISSFSVSIDARGLEATEASGGGGGGCSLQIGDSPSSPATWIVLFFSLFFVLSLRLAYQRK